MIPNKLIKQTASALIILYFTSCTTTYEVTRRSELNLPDDLGEITVTTKDNNKYITEKYLLQDSTLSFSGSIVKDGSEKPYSGKLNLSEIKKIEAKEGSLGKSVLIAGAGAAVIITFIAFLSKGNGVNNDVVVTYPSGSCNGSASRFFPQYTDRPLAGGLMNIADKNISSTGSPLHLDVINESGKFHFSVKNEPESIELELIDTPADCSNAVTIDLRKIK